jgi:hypothetical protein
MPLFSNYNEWRRTITGACRMDLTRAYCQERRRALADDRDPSTRDFLKAYGTDYRDRVAAWFRQAESEARS